MELRWFGKRRPASPSMEKRQGRREPEPGLRDYLDALGLGKHVNELYLRYRVQPMRIDLQERLIKNGAAPAGETARMLDELLDAEAGDLRGAPSWEEADEPPPHKLY